MDKPRITRIVSLLWTAALAAIVPAVPFIPGAEAPSIPWGLSVIMAASLAIGWCVRVMWAHLFPDRRGVVLAEKPPRTKLRGKPLRGSLARKYGKGA